LGWNFFREKKKPSLSFSSREGLQQFRISGEDEISDESVALVHAAITWMGATSISCDNMNAKEE